MNYDRFYYNNQNYQNYQENPDNQDSQEREISGQSDFVENQQFFQGGTSRLPQQPDVEGQQQPGRGGQQQPGRGGQQQPGRGGPPPAPPSFTPEMPRGGQQSFGGSPGEQFRGGGQNWSRNYRACLNRVTYIWLYNGSNFWFFPTFIGRRQIEGFRWRQGRWVYERINLNRILFFTCF